MVSDSHAIDMFVYQGRGSRSMRRRFEVRGGGRMMWKWFVGMDDDGVFIHSLDGCLIYLSRQ